MSSSGSHSYPTGRAGAKGDRRGAYGSRSRAAAWREVIFPVGLRETKKTIPLPPVLGGISLIGGIALLLAGSRNP